MTPTIAFRAYGDPKGQPRPRAFARGGKASVYDPGTAEGWKSQIAAAAQPHLPDVPFDGPVAIKARFLFKRPKRLMRKRDPQDRIAHTGKPDLDNCVKALLDCLTTIGMWRDDSQVWLTHSVKWYVALPDERPGAEIEIHDAS